MVSTTCKICKRNFDSLKGLNIHYASCKRKERHYIRRINTDTITGNLPQDENTHVETTVSSILESDVLLIENNQTFTPNLPAYPEVKQLAPEQIVHNLPGDIFEEQINAAYDEVIFWRKNLFMLPAGKAAKNFIRELTFWLDQFNRDTKLQSIAMKVFMGIPSLLLQKPSRQSKAKEHHAKLEERFQLWKAGEISLLLKEGRTIQKRLVSGKRRTSEDVSRIFAKLMMEGKVHNALKFLSDENDAGVLPANDDIIDELKLKHPPPQPIQPETLLQGPLTQLEPSYFDNINEDLIKVATRLTKGVAGPSKLDSDQFKNMLVNNRFKNEGKELREQISILTRKLATTIIDPASIDSLVACNLIPLSKNPGIRPIGVGETLRRIMGKAINWTLKEDIQSAAGPLQVATGVESGAEAAIHAMREIFEANDCEAVILIDASNAFNALNRNVALHNIQYTCPHFATILINTYRNSSRMIIRGGKEIRSQEGTTQGDNLAMSFYAISTVLMQESLRSVISVKQVWLADDATGAGIVDRLLDWWNMVIAEGSKYGYYVNESKSWLIAKNEEVMELAKEKFKHSSIKYTIDGKRHLGAVIGSPEFRAEYSKKKIDKWCGEMKKLAEIAITEPQAAFAAYTHGEMHKFNYFLRTIPNMQQFLEPLDRVIDDQFLPAVFGTTISEQDRDLLKLPIRDGGLGVPVLREKAEIDFQSSIAVTVPLKEVIIEQGNTLPSKERVKQCRSDRSQIVNTCQTEERDRIIGTLNENMKRVTEQNQEKGSSSWLTVLPLEDQGFSMTKEEFRDALSLRYDRKVTNLPSKCACGEKFDQNHAMNCKKGGYVTIRHNNVRDFEANLLKIVCNDVEVEPKLQPVQNDEARLDIRARGFWRPGQSAYFDVRLTNVNSKSQIKTPINNIYKNHENEKKRKYNERVINNEHGSFTPLVFSINGGMSHEGLVFHKHLAQKIASKTGQRYESIMSWIRCKLSFVIMRSALLCLRGSRSVKVNVEASDDFAFACDEAGL